MLRPPDGAAHDTTVDADGAIWQHGTYSTLAESGPDGQNDAATAKCWKRSEFVPQADPPDSSFPGRLSVATPVSSQLEDTKPVQRSYLSH